MLLKRLSETHGVSGQEKKVRDQIKAELEGFVDEMYTDSIGNLIVRKKGVSDISQIAVVAPMDEVGLMVTKITSDGLIKFTPAGNFDTRMLVSKAVSIGEKAVKGVIGAKPIHLQDSSERKTALKVSQLYIDIGASKKEEAEKHVCIGDYVAIDSAFREYGKSLVKGKALEGRAACSLLVELLKQKTEYSFYGVFTVMREVGIFGGGPAVYKLDPEYTIILDGSDSELGKGPVVSIKELRTMFDLSFSRRILELAKAESIPVQISGMDHIFSDGARVQTARGGNKAMKIGIPCKYMKTPVSFMDMEDYRNTAKLLEKTIAMIGGKDIEL